MRTLWEQGLEAHSGRDGADLEIAKMLPGVGLLTQVFWLAATGLRFVVGWGLNDGFPEDSAPAMGMATRPVAIRGQGVDQSSADENGDQ